MIAIRYKPQKETGPSIAEHAKKVVADWVEDVLSDCKETPMALFKDKPPAQPKPGQKRRRRDGMPYYRSGTLVEGLFFKPASRGGAKAGIIGHIMAPAIRFAFPPPIAKRMIDGFVALIDSLHVARGVGWSRSRRGR